MSLVSYDPLRVLNELHNEMNRVFNRRLGLLGGTDESAVVTSQWMPEVDIKEAHDRFILYADVPGVDPKDIEVTMENGVLTIKGERRQETKAEGESFTRLERTHGTFYRRFALPDSADPERIEARDKNGVLEIVVHKRESSLPRRIPITA